VQGLLAGVVLVVVGHRVISHSEIDPRQYAEADFRKLVLIPGVLTVHSFPEGLGAGADLPRGGRPELVAGLLVGVLAIVPLAFV